MSILWQRFWDWYDRTLASQTIFVSAIFVWQLVHLYWLTTHVVAQRLWGHSFFTPSSFSQVLIVIADYAEIPALLGASLLYINQLRKKFALKSLIYLVMLNSQWIHLFWITDQYVVNVFTDTTGVIPTWFAWVAIGIDYLELPVMYDTIRRSLRYAREYLRLA